MDAWLFAGAGGGASAVGGGRQVLATGEAGGQRLRGTQPRLHLRTVGGLRPGGGVAASPILGHREFWQPFSSNPVQHFRARRADRLSCIGRSAATPRVQSRHEVMASPNNKPDGETT